MYYFLDRQTQASGDTKSPMAALSQTLAVVRRKPDNSTSTWLTLFLPVISPKGVSWTTVAVYHLTRPQGLERVGLRTCSSIRDWVGVCVYVWKQEWKSGKGREKTETWLFRSRESEEDKISVPCSDACDSLGDTFARLQDTGASQMFHKKV